MTESDLFRMLIQALRLVAPHNSVATNIIASGLVALVIFVLKRRGSIKRP